MGEGLAITSTPTGVSFAVKVIPNASRDQIVGLLGDALKVKVAAPPEAGKANQAVCALLARALSINAHAVQVVQGHSQPHKRIEVVGAAPDAIRAVIR